MSNAELLTSIIVKFKVSSFKFRRSREAASDGMGPPGFEPGTNRL